MKSIGTLTIALGLVGATALSGQIPAPAGRRTGPGVQSAQDAREPEVLAACKNPPPARGGRGRGKGFPQAKGKGRGPGPAQAATGPREYAVTAIPGVIAAGQQWKEIWTVEGNNADGIIATRDGGLLIAQNDNSTVIKLDASGKDTVAYTGTNTGGSLAMNSKGAIFVVNRGLMPSIEQLAPERRTLADRYQGDPLDCLGGVLNDATADSKGGVYFTDGVVYHADAKGTVTRYGENLFTNGIVLSPDEKKLWVTNGGTLAVFDVQSNGSLTNQREFAQLEAGGGDGSTLDSAGRIYVTSGAGIQVVGPDGKYLGLIPTPYGTISAAFSGPDRKMLYAVARQGNTDWIIGIQMLAQGPAGRGK